MIGHDGGDNDLSGDDIIIVVRVNDDTTGVGGDLVRRLLSPGRGRCAEDQFRPVSDNEDCLVMVGSKDSGVYLPCDDFSYLTEDILSG